MPVTVQVYNHTTRRFLEGSNNVSDTYKVLLATSATFSAAHVNLADITYTEVADGNGYSTGGATLANVAVNTVTTNDAALTADTVIWNANGGPIVAAFGILYNASSGGSPPVAFLNFGGTQTAGDQTEFKIIWSPSGIFSLTIA